MPSIRNLLVSSISPRYQTFPRISNQGSSMTSNQPLLQIQTLRAFIILTHHPTKHVAPTSWESQISITRYTKAVITSMHVGVLKTHGCWTLLHSELFAFRASASAFEMWLQHMWLEKSDGFKPGTQHVQRYHPLSEVHPRA